MTPLRRLARDRRGAVTLVTAGGLSALLMATAVAVDIGSVFLERRRLQGIADAAALAGVAQPVDRRGAVTRTLAANGAKDAAIVRLEGGDYTPDGTIAADARFVPGGEADNAVGLTLSRQVPLFFAGIVAGRQTVGISAKATAARLDYAAFSLGTRLAGVEGGLPNALLSALAGTNLSLSLMDYNALVGARVDLLGFTDALASELHLTGLSYGEILASEVTLPQALSALATRIGDPAAAGAVRAIAMRVPGTTITLSRLIDLGPYAQQDHPDPGTAIAVGGYAMLSEMLMLANGGRQVRFDLGVTLPGIDGATVTLAIGERPARSPWLAVARDRGTVVRTAQTRLLLDARLANAASLGLVSLRLPIYVQLAEAQARLAAVTCVRGSGAAVSLDVSPSVGHVAVADVATGALDDFGKAPAEAPAILARAPLLAVTGSATLALGGTRWLPLDFSAAEIASGTVKSVSTGDVVQGVAASLARRLDLRATAGGVTIPGGALSAAVGAAIVPLAPGLDALLDHLMALLGLRIGQADVAIAGARCGKPTLVG